jgi:repressor LexA
MRTLAADGVDVRPLIVQSIRDFLEEHGYPPTVREIGRAVGIGVQSTHRHLIVLARAGVITWEPGCARTIRLVA